MRHERADQNGNVPPKLYDLAIENHAIAKDLQAWKDSYKDGPLDTGAKVIEFVEETHVRLKHHSDLIKELEKSNAEQHAEIIKSLEEKGYSIEEIQKSMALVCKRKEGDGDADCSRNPS